MPTAIDEKVDGFAHCSNSRCSGNRQAPVKVVRRTTSYTYKDLGGDGQVNGVERSVVHVVFASAKDEACPACGDAREATDQKRPVYPTLSGHSQDGLLSLKTTDGRVVTLEQSDEVAELRAQVAALSKLVADQSTGKAAA